VAAAQRRDHARGPLRVSAGWVPTWRLAWPLAILGLAAPASAYAHPHAFVVYSVVLPVTPQGLDRVGFVFTFDPLFSAVILRDRPVDPASRSRPDPRTLDQIPFEIEIAFNEAPVALERPIDLQVTEQGGQVTYRFTVPLQTPLIPPGAIDIRVDDPGFFVAFSLRDADPAEIQASEHAIAACRRAVSPTGAPGALRCEYKTAS
jgi:ABC-type uncharacterized transport system substrate-binding protein